MLESLRIATLITTPIALLAFFSVLLFAFLSSREKNKLRALESVLPEDRLTVALGEANAFALSENDLNPEDKFELMLEITRHRAKSRADTLRWSSITLIVLVLILVAGQVAGNVLQNQYQLPTPAGVNTQAARSTDGSVGFIARYLRESVPEGVRASIEIARESQSGTDIIHTSSDVQRSAQISGDFAEIAGTLSQSAAPIGASLMARLVLTTIDGDRAEGEWSRIDIQEHDP